MSEKDDTKEAVKEAFKEWVDEKVQAFGWWSLKTIGMLIVGAILYFFVQTHGFKR